MGPPVSISCCVGAHVAVRRGFLPYLMAVSRALLLLIAIALSCSTASSVERLDVEWKVMGSKKVCMVELLYTRPTESGSSSRDKERAEQPCACGESDIPRPYSRTRTHKIAVGSIIFQTIHCVCSLSQPLWVKHSSD